MRRCGWRKGRRHQTPAGLDAPAGGNLCRQLIDTANRLWVVNGENDVAKTTPTLAKHQPELTEPVRMAMPAAQSAQAGLAT